MLESLLSLLTGGATGLLGTSLSGAIAYFERAQRHKHEIEQRRFDLAIAKTESASAERVAAIEAETAEGSAAWDAFEVAHAGAGVRWSSGESPWLVAVDVVRGLIRPVLTVAFLVLAAVIYFSIPSIAPIDAVTRCIDTVLYLATTTTLWWFGTRPMRRME